MTRFVVDAGAVIHVVSTGVKISGEHKLLAPKCCQTCMRPSSAARSLPTLRATA
jgi:hypothetical protein